MNKKGLSAIIKAILTLVVIFVVVLMIFAFKSSFEEESGPMVDYFNAMDPDFYKEDFVWYSILPPLGLYTIPETAEDLVPQR